VTKFLNANDTAATKYLEQNDYEITKFLQMAIGNFLLDSDAVEQLLSLKSEYDINITNFLETNNELARN
jgi:hypothetical protein